MKLRIELPPSDVDYNTDPIGVSNFKSFRMSVAIQNGTAGTIIPPEKKPVVYRISERSMWIDVPKKSCAEGHHLELSIRCSFPNAPDLEFLVTAKVMAVDVSQTYRDSIEIQFIQFPDQQWKTVRKYLEYRQSEIERFLTAGEGNAGLPQNVETQTQTGIFKDFLRGKDVLIVDESVHVVGRVASLLNSLGVEEERIFRENSLDSALEVIESKKPAILICEYELGGIQLMRAQKKHALDSQKRLLVSISTHTSQAAVASTIEEDVDAFVLKPFMDGVFQDGIIRAVQVKHDLSEYRKNLTALYHRGELEIVQGNFGEAQKYFLEGLRLNPMHQKCMARLLDALIGQKLLEESYAVIKRLCHSYPTEPGRLLQMMRLAITTGNRAEIDKFYQVFMSMDMKDHELLKYVEPALVVCGEYYLQNKRKAEAIDLFNQAVKALKASPKVLKEVIFILAQNHFKNEAEEYFKLFPPHAKNTIEYREASLILKA